jgi:hypothetical protein
MIGGEVWAQWYGMLKEQLLGAVISKGDTCYWEPNRLDPGRGVGPVYCTSVYAMILAMPYHYVPLYQR